MTFKKHSILTSLFLSSLLIVSACGREDQVTEHIGEQGNSEEATGSPAEANPDGGVDEAGGEMFGFTEFELDVDYPDQDNALQASYAENRQEVFAEYKNQETGDELEGDQAWDQIEPAFTNLEITSEMPDEEVISAVTEAFEVKDGYSSIEIEVRYADGTDKEYKATGE